MSLERPRQKIPAAADPRPGVRPWIDFPRMADRSNVAGTPCTMPPDNARGGIYLPQCFRMFPIDPTELADLNDPTEPGATNGGRVYCVDATETGSTIDLIFASYGYDSVNGRYTVLKQTMCTMTKFTADEVGSGFYWWGWFVLGTAGWREKLTFPAAGVNATVTAVDQGTKTFTVGSDVSADLETGDIIGIRGSTGNDGTYTVVSATETAGSTDVVVNEAIPSATADGTLYTSTYLIDADDVDIAAYAMGQSVNAKWIAARNVFRWASRDTNEVLYVEPSTAPVWSNDTTDGYLLMHPLAMRRYPRGHVTLRWAGNGQNALVATYRHHTTGEWYQGIITGCTRETAGTPVPSLVLNALATHTDGSQSMKLTARMADGYYLQREWTSPTEITS